MMRAVSMVCVKASLNLFKSLGRQGRPYKHLSIPTSVPVAARKSKSDKREKDK